MCYELKGIPLVSTLLLSTQSRSVTETENIFAKVLLINERVQLALCKARASYH